MSKKTLRKLNAKVPSAAMSGSSFDVRDMIESFFEIAPPIEWHCANCGDTSADAGRFRKAEDCEPSDDNGEVYECSTCGSHDAMPPAHYPAWKRLLSSNNRISDNDDTKSIL